MKLTQCIQWTVLALALAQGGFAAAQSNTVPGPTDYDRFSSFVTSRNIFDPNRYAREGPRVRTYQPPRYAPTFRLVGTMSYAKGMFAFFDGNQDGLRKVLYPTDTNGIAGYVLVGITTTNVTLQSADKKQTVWMYIGQAMRQEGNEWLLADQNGRTVGYSTEDTPAPGADNSNSSTDSGATSTPSSSLGQNDILKRLMQQRQQELK